MRGMRERTFNPRRLRLRPGFRSPMRRGLFQLISLVMSNNQDLLLQYFNASDRDRSGCIDVRNHNFSICGLHSLLQ